MTRLLAGVGALLAAAAVAFGCDDSSVPEATQTALSIEATSAAFIQTPFPTSTPIPLDRNLLRAPPACAGCLVVADVHATQGIDPLTGEITVISEIPAEATAPYYWQPSPDGTMWTFPCNADGSLNTSFVATRCLWGYGLSGRPIPDPLESGQYLYSIAKSWSPDSRFLLMLATSDVSAGTSGSVPETRAYIHDVRAGTTKNIGGRAPFQEFGEPSWSPDGTKLAIARTRNGVYSNVLVADVATAATELISSDEKDLVLSIGGIVWSPDSRQVAFVRDTVEPLTPVAGAVRSFRHAIVIAAIDGSTIRELPVSFGKPVGWSPDGRWLLVARSDPPSRATGYQEQPLVYAMRTDDSGSEHLLSDGFVMMTDAVFSLDGSRVAFIGTGDPNDNTTRGLFVVSIEGGAPVKMPLDDLPYAPPSPIWTPDGRSIVYASLGICGQGGCSPGALFNVNASGDSPPVELLPRVSQVLGWLPE